MSTRQTRVGIGFDAHRFIPHQNNNKNTISLCGVQVNSIYAVEAHSDGDVALHALVDAMLGSIAAGDIGQHFPPSDPKWKNVESTIFVSYALDLIKQKNGELNNIDIVIIAEKPYILPYRALMQQRLSELLNLDLDRVSIKATTTEKMGFTGREEGIAAQAIISVLI
ncbi:unnamed protein product [Didymodactylos carnosus]|uniref:2-C-methyl-D-erythritol 2,4-cyclodiphosphate synthase n=1 Tax=Didymodactylos carnosus TaxID=1234261 RepID=A0A813P854_9BILA|nr:unnamed protein product [Didymodactylos carnosus]CAF1196611.1 unnamed protein product [Didymodactylos carnosus]CAF3528079.1 unnamed protein product [Didymodactylos carnosus]CAF4006874.1 unnamed protein product [Didymodactylos carnosus]